MKQFISRFDNFARSQSSLAILALCLIAAISAACRLGNYFPSGNPSVSNVAPANVNNGTANQMTSATSNSAAAGFCQLAYFPIGDNLNHKYRITYQSGGLAPHEYTESFRNIADDSFTLHLQFSDVQVDNNWRCTKEGLLATQFNDNSVKTNNGVDAKIETIRSEGITLPPDSRWRAGEQWTTDYDVKETMNLPNSAMHPTGEGNIKLAGEIVGEESVTVPAGTFQAMKLRIIQKINLTMKINGAAMTVPQIPFETTAWYAKNIGMVKSVSTSNGSTVGTTELLSTSER